jgi:hypothetical protein
MVAMAENEFGFAVLTANGTPLGLLGRIPGQVSFSMMSSLGSPMAFTFDDRIPDVTLFVCRDLPMPLIPSSPFLEHYDLTIKSRARELVWQGYTFQSTSSDPGTVPTSTIDPLRPDEVPNVVMSIAHIETGRWTAYGPDFLDGGLNSRDKPEFDPSGEPVLVRSAQTRIQNSTVLPRE